MDEYEKKLRFFYPELPKDAESQCMIRREQSGIVKNVREKGWLAACGFRHSSAIPTLRSVFFDFRSHALTKVSVLKNIYVGLRQLAHKSRCLF
jgi:hypothetical protein